MNVLIINGHPGKDTFNHALANAFKKGAQKTSVSLKTLEVNDMKLRLDMTGFNKEKAIPENILKAQGMIAWADHLVWIYPTWWSTMPAMLKAFFEQVFISGFAFEYKQSTQVVKWDKFLKGKSAQIISTMDSPPWYYKLFVGDPGFKTVKDIMNFCGIKPVKRTYFGSVKVSTEKQRQKWLDKAEQLGRKLK
ncbi:MAG: flavodoxin family protein [Bacteroidetes bacterium]|nr:MAG: flavodoxin family protein [Bacteroidota bacterium]